jgi:hypothetical protein
MVAAFYAKGSQVGIPLLWIFFLTALLLFQLESMPQCTKDCNRTFANEAALSRHRKTCPVFEIVRQRSHELRRGKIGGSQSLQKDSTLLSRKERLQASGYQLEFQDIAIHISRRIMQK